MQSQCAGTVPRVTHRRNPAMTKRSIEGKTVLIAGGAKNLGGLLARDLAQHGAKAIAAVGRPDIAVNTVGKVIKKPIGETSEAEYDQMSAINAKSAFFFLKEAGRHVNDHGAIVTLVTSLLGAFTPFYAT